VRELAFLAGNQVLSVSIPLDQNTRATLCAFAYKFVLCLEGKLALALQQPCSCDPFQIPWSSLNLKPLLAVFFLIASRPALFATTRFLLFFS